MSNYNNVNVVLIGDGVQSATITALPQIKKGDLLLLNEAGNVITSNAAAAALPKSSKVFVAVGVGTGKAILSSPIQGNSVTKYEGKAFNAPVEQIAYIGYNGTSGTGLDISTSTQYRLRITIADNFRVNGQRLTLSDFTYVGDTTATPQKAIDSIACSYSLKEYGVNAVGSLVQLDRVSDGTFTALTNNATVTKGSKVVTSTAHGLVVGNYVRIGGTTFSAPIYKVAEVSNANTVVLDLAYQGDTATVLAANIGKMTAQTEFGFKLTGLSQDALLSRADNEPYDGYEWVNFSAFFSEADGRNYESAATYKVAQQANPGNGYWKQVAEREEAAKGYLGDTSKRRWHDKRINSVVNPAVGYDTIVITHSDTHRGDFQGLYDAPLQTEIYIPDGTAQGTNSGDEFLHILNGFFTTLGFTAITF